ncbi:hypothetical protein [Hyunsoonleella rubra]|uniref:Uncharacterized protein n=1 Tax=Hyunsoonleella rubra TaxID=1737062 RepID=A0ABW5T7B7_9FLAO
MNLYPSDKVRFISGLIIILIIYTFHYVYLAENPDMISVPKYILHLARFAVTMAVYFVGTFHLGKLKDTWMSTIWHMVHISGLCIIAGLGGFNWLISDISIYLKDFTNSVQEILISPVLYLAMGILNRTLNKKTSD